MGATTPTWLDAAAKGSDTHRRWCADVLVTYFHHTIDGLPAYSGGRFDGFGDNPPDRITTDDIVAVSLLNAKVRGHAPLRLLEHDADAISTLLAQVRTDVDLHEAAPELIDHDSAAERLWTCIRGRGGLSGVGPVATSKLLARKRPRLLPVYDEVVAGRLGLGDHRDHWLEVHGLLRRDPAYVEVLREAHHAADLPEEVSLLRTFDVLLWMSDPAPLPPP